MKLEDFVPSIFLLLCWNISYNSVYCDVTKGINTSTMSLTTSWAKLVIPPNKIAIFLSPSKTKDLFLRCTVIRGLNHWWETVLIFSLINNAELLENKDLENLEPLKINAIFRMAAECMLCNLLDSDIADTKSMAVVKAPLLGHNRYAYCQPGLKSCFKRRTLWINVHKVKYTLPHMYTIALQTQTHTHLSAGGDRLIRRKDTVPPVCHRRLLILLPPPLTVSISE